MVWLRLGVAQRLTDALLYVGLDTLSGGQILACAPPMHRLVMTLFLALDKGENRNTKAD